MRRQKVCSKADIASLQQQESFKHGAPPYPAPHTPMPPLPPARLSRPRFVSPITPQGYAAKRAVAVPGLPGLPARDGHRHVTGQRSDGSSRARIACSRFSTRNPWQSRCSWQGDVRCAAAAKRRRARNASARLYQPGLGPALR
jgi:hypothetical protein